MNVNIMSKGNWIDLVLYNYSPTRTMVCTHSLTHLLTHPLTHSYTHSLRCAILLSEA